MPSSRPIKSPDLRPSPTRKRGQQSSKSKARARSLLEASAKGGGDVFDESEDQIDIEKREAYLDADFINDDVSEDEDEGEGDDLGGGDSDTSGSVEEANSEDENFLDRVDDSEQTRLTEKERALVNAEMNERDASKLRSDGGRNTSVGGRHGLNEVTQRWAKCIAAEYSKCRERERERERSAHRSQPIG